MNRQQAIPPGASLERPTLSEDADFSARHPDVAKACQTVIGALRQDMLPMDVQEQLFDSMGAGVQRNLVAKYAGLDASILMTFKQQLSLISSILRRTYNEDGTLTPGSEDIGMDPKDVISLSLKVSQMMIKDMPKVYNMERIQRMENALSDVIAEHMDREQQDAFLLALERRKNSP